MEPEPDDEPRNPRRLADTARPLSKPTVLYIEHDAPTVRFVDLLLEQRPGFQLLSADRGSGIS
jgi:hypothetical protein